LNLFCVFSNIIFQLRHSVVGSFLFLRFICPGLVSPEDAEIITTPISADSRKILVLLSKILQNIANGTLPKVRKVKEDATLNNLSNNLFQRKNRWNFLFLLLNKG
jgi:hypothetical protein